MAHGKETTCTYWVCIDCMLTNEQGEEPHDKEDGCNPWSLLESNQTMTRGILKGEHRCGWEETDSGTESPEECGCDMDDFSKSPCDGCGQYLAGQRYAYTVWTPVD